MTPIERVEQRLAEVKSSRQAAEAAEKWTAVSTLSAAEDKLTQQLLEMEAEAAELAATADDDLNATELLDSMTQIAMGLPSYLLDELIDRLEQARKLTPVTEWVPK